MIALCVFGGRDYTDCNALSETSVNYTEQGCKERSGDTDNTFRFDFGGCATVVSVYCGRILPFRVGAPDSTLPQDTVPARGARRSTSTLPSVGRMLARWSIVFQTV